MSQGRPEQPLARLSGWLPVLIAAHAAAWVLLPLILEGSIRLDVAEGAIGGREWQLAYIRHPPFTTWLTELARETGPLRYAAVYAIGQALALSGLLLVARTAARMEDDAARGRAVAALTLAFGLASPVLTYIPIQVSHNVGLMLASGLVLVTAWTAFERGTLASWLLFGLAVGFSLWVKYAIALLILPLMAAFLAVPAWREQLRRPGPWLAVAIALLVITPHAVVVARQGATTIAFATRTVSPGLLANLAYAAEFILNAGLFMAVMGIAAGLLAGFGTLGRRIAASLSPGAATRADLFRHAAAFGPVAITTAAALVAGVKPRLLWLTPMVPIFAMWWAHLAWPADDGEGGRGRWGLGLLAGTALLLIATYVAIRLVAPYANPKPLYPDFDGPALARLATEHWRSHESAPLRYLVSFGAQRGRQAAGSVAFDLPSPADAPLHVMEDASLAASPWIAVDDLKRRGALVVSSMPLAPGTVVEGRPVTQIAELPRPMVRGATQPAARIWLGIVEPSP